MPIRAKGFQWETNAQVNGEADYTFVVLQPPHGVQYGMQKTPYIKWTKIYHSSYWEK